MADDAPTEESPITFNIKSSSDAKYVLTLPLSTTVIDLKTKLSTPQYADLPPERQRLIYSGRVLKDPDTLGSYKIKDGHTVHLVKGAASNQRQNPANQGSSTATGTSGTATPAAAGVPTNIATGTGNNLLAGLTGARYAGFAQLPSAGMFGPDGGMGPPPDPEQMASMLENPQFQSTLNEALQNPQILDMMIQQNPMLREMGPMARQMLQTPEFRRMLTDPEALRNMHQLQRAMGGMGGMMGGLGGARGSEQFPAPGVTDTTPEGTSWTPQQPNATPTAGQQPAAPFNPMALFGANPAGQAGNPFAALFNPSALGAPPATSTPPPPGTQQPAAEPAPAGQQNAPANPFGAMFGAGDPTAPPPQAAGAGTQQPQNPFANLANNPFFQNPALMQQVMAAMNNGGGGGGGGAPSIEATAGIGAGGFNPFAALLGGEGGAPAVQDTRPPEDRYAEQLRQLNEMGFYEFERNVEALRRTGGSVPGAVEYLLTH